ncbi:MAG: alpha-1,4-glucan--maltose-1-phosphate maltosyltransferase [Flavobacteriales bacterium]|nr:alpha-1,4-glucan--maltose-1-phosphate maltosyltransferase [Flavobacteriales bacterium]
MQNQARVVIENIQPQLNGGQFYIKRIIDQWVHVTADVIADGHDVLVAVLQWKHEKEKQWCEVPMQLTTNDAWSAKFRVKQQGHYHYRVAAWVDYALNWQHGTERKINDGQYVKSELLEGAEYCKAILNKANKDEKKWLKEVIACFEDTAKYEQAIAFALSEELHQIFTSYPARILGVTSAEYPVYVDRKKALFSTWYEFFPRSASSTLGKHGTFKDCERLLPRVAEMGFDTLYFPPIHPIGEVNRKGKNNATTAQLGDVGSPWGIGSVHGGHQATHPELGTIEDFKSLVKTAKSYGIEIAMDYALQAAPDHPYVKDHPQWFKWRPDGTVQYAENPPKKYQDIQPIYFESEDWKNLWAELLKVALFWVEECDIKVFRVDNPHTKPFHFWGWLIGEIKKKHPDVLFLSEAFTRPKIMHQLAKQGFTQSYTYYTWRTTKEELSAYLTELTQTEQKEFFRPNFWPNTPDILPYHLQSGNETMYLIRYFLAATMSSNVGVYGPAYEFLVHEAIPGKEEYYNSEKYEVYHWDWNARNKITMLMTRINQIRKERLSLQQTNNVVLCETTSSDLIAFLKYDDDHTDHTLMVCNLDPYYPKQGSVQLPLKIIGNQPVRVTDLITGNSYWWDKEWNYVELHPALPFHLFKLER